MIDIHTHILPKMDDGSQSIEQSIEMLKKMCEQGIETIVATPHFDMRKESIDDFIKRRDESFESLSQNGVDTKGIVLGVEVLYCGIGISRMEGIEKLCIGDTNYMLIELMSGSWDDSFESAMVRLMTEQNITPILAHVERYADIRKKRAAILNLQRMGMVVQVSGDYFTHRLTRRAAIKLLKHNRAQVLGSDCHNLDDRGPNMSEALEVIRNELGEAMVKRLMDNADKIISGKYL